MPNYPTDFSVQFLDENNEIVKQVIGHDPVNILFVHFDGTIETITPFDPLPPYELADKTSSIELYADGSVSTYRYSDTTTAEAPYVRIEYAHVPPEQRATFGEDNQYSNGPVTYSESFLNGVKETKTFVDGVPVTYSVTKLNNVAQEVFKLEGAVSNTGIATITLTNLDHPGGIMVSGQGGLVGLLTLDTAQLISDNGIGLIGQDGGTLVGQDGGSLISDAGWTFDATRSSSLISDNGIGLISDNGAVFAPIAANLVGQDGGTLQAYDAAAAALNIMASMRGYRAYEGPSTFEEIGDDYGEAISDDDLGSIDVGETVTGSLEEVGDSDWFAVTLEAGKEYTISMRGLDSGNALLRDPSLTLRDANGVAVEVNGTPVADEDGGIGRDARITFTATTSGTYHIVAGSDGDAYRGAYELEVKASPNAAFVKSAAVMDIAATPLGSAPVMAHITAGAYAGGFVLAWIATSDGQHAAPNYSDYHLQVQIVMADGTIVDLDPREQYTTYSPDHANPFYDADDGHPSITVFDDGSFTVSYNDSSYGDPRHRTTLLRMDADGQPVSTSTMIPGGASVYGSSGGDVVTLANGDDLTVFHRFGVDGVSDITNIQVSLNGGAPITIATGTDMQGWSAMYQRFTTAATAFGNGAVAVWTEGYGDTGTIVEPGGSAPTHFGVRGAVLSSSGTVLATFDVNEQVEFAQYINNGSQIVDLGDGRFVVAWTSDNAGRILDSYFRVFSYDDGTVTPVTGDVAIGALAMDDASIVALPSGGFVIVYARESDIRMQTYSDAGVPIGNETVVATGGYAGGTSAVATEDGRIVVAFHQGGGIKLQYMEPNQAPTDITLSTDHIAENGPVLSFVATLGTVDGNGITDSFTYSIVDPDGKFYISGNELRAYNPFNYEQAQSHTVTIRTTDSAGITLDETFTIHVDNVNENPTGLTIDQLFPSESAAVGSVLATLTATDIDNAGSFTYALVDQNGQALTGSPFVIDGNQLKLASALDYEGTNGFTIYVRVSDGTLSTGPYNTAPFPDARVSIYVQDVDDTAPHNIRLSNFTDDEFEVDEDVAVGSDLLTLITSDRDSFGEENFTYQILNSDGTFRLEVDENGYTHLVLNRALNFEAAAEHTLSLRVSDPGGRSYDETFTIDVGDVNEAPIITGGGTRKDISVPVGTSINTILYAIAATDPDGDSISYGFRGFDGTFFFDMDAQGNMRFESSPGFATTYNFEVYAYDGQYATYQDVRVTVTSAPPANNAPVIYGNPSITAQVNENATQVVMVEAADADFDTLTWSLGGPDASKFKIVAISNSYVGIEFKVAPDFESPTDVGSNNTYNVAIIATDPDGDWDSQSIAVQVQNVSETPPMPPSITSNGGGATAKININENLLAVTTVAATGTGPITYSLSGADASDFTINASTGQLSFRSPADFEAPADANKDNKYLVTVHASNGTSSDSQALTVNVRDLQAPAKTGSNKRDKLNGTASEEKLDGKEGNDTVKGLAGGDTIVGGKGADKLYGGVDGVSDTFAFLKGDSGIAAGKFDQVFDFVSGIDRIDLSGIDGDPARGQQDLRFVTKFAAPGTKTDGQIRFVDAGNHVNIEIDLDGNKKADMIIQVMNVDTLLKSDLIL
jgi:hypothetical protein